MKRSHLVLFLFFLPTLILGETQIRIITDYYAPFSFEQDGVIKGICPEIIEEILKSVKIKAKIEIYPWSRAYNIGLNNKNVMMITLVRNKMREKLFKWGAPLLPAEQALFSLKHTKKIRSLQEMRSHKIGTIQNDITEQYLENKQFNHGKNLFQFSTYEESVLMLFNGRVDSIAATTATTLYYAKSLKLPANKLKKIFVFKDLKLNIYMAFSLNTPDKTINIFTQALSNFKKKKKFKEIINKYL